VKNYTTLTEDKFRGIQKLADRLTACLSGSLHAGGFDGRKTGIRNEVAILDSHG